METKLKAVNSKLNNAEERIRALENRPFKNRKRSTEKNCKESMRDLFSKSLSHVRLFVTP